MCDKANNRCANGMRHSNVYSTTQNNSETLDWFNDASQQQLNMNYRTFFYIIIAQEEYKCHFFPLLTHRYAKTWLNCVDCIVQGQFSFVLESPHFYSYWIHRVNYSLTKRLPLSSALLAFYWFFSILFSGKCWNLKDYNS